MRAHVDENDRQRPSSPGDRNGRPAGVDTKDRATPPLPPEESSRLRKRGCGRVRVIRPQGSQPQPGGVRCVRRPQNRPFRMRTRTDRTHLEGAFVLTMFSRRLRLAMDLTVAVVVAITRKKHSGVAYSWRVRRVSARTTAEIAGPTPQPSRKPFRGLPGLAGGRRTASVLAPLNDARPALEHQSHDVGWQRAR